MKIFLHSTTLQPTKMSLMYIDEEDDDEKTIQVIRILNSISSLETLTLHCKFYSM